MASLSSAHEAEMSPDEHRLLDRLAGGKTLGDAGTELHLSRRTADRRLASAREKLGVGTTAEAVVAYIQPHG
jgi:DNA-binding CsgD family transcriptional regulator